MRLLLIFLGNFDCFMIKEIYDQPESVINTMRGRVNFDTLEITLGGLSEHLIAIRRCRRLMFIACGTSYHSALAVRFCNFIVKDLLNLFILDTGTYGRTNRTTRYGGISK